jgi:hypothetical protein
MKCPRCGSKLCEVEPGAIWLRYFICHECLGCWHLESTRYLASEGRTRFWKTETFLVFGRNLRPISWREAKERGVA